MHGLGKAFALRVAQQLQKRGEKKQHFVTVMKIKTHH